MSWDKTIAFSVVLLSSATFSPVVAGDAPNGVGTGTELACNTNRCGETDQLTDKTPVPISRNRDHSGKHQNPGISDLGKNVSAAHAGEVRREAWGALRQEIITLRHSLARDGAYAFVTNAATPKVAPHIHSQCWVDWLPKEEVERLLYEQEIRDFGLDIIGELEQYALRQEALREPDELDKMVTELVRIAAWAKTSRGYGNCAIKQWAEGLAIGLIGKMAVDSRIDAEVVERHLAGIDSYFDDLRLRVDILREEAPHAYQMPLSNNPSDAFGDLSRQWGKNRTAAIEHYGFARFSSMNFTDAINDKREFAFYVEDSRGRYLTAREFWSRKRHWDLLGMGSDYRRIEKIRRILLFRRIAGAVPVPMAEDLQDEQLAERFRDSVNDMWQPYFTKHGQNYIGSLVLSVWRGTFVDEWTRQYMWQESDLL